jgi:hypothetical protein
MHVFVFLHVCMYKVIGEGNSNEAWIVNCVYACKLQCACTRVDTYMQDHVKIHEDDEDKDQRMRIIMKKTLAHAYVYKHIHTGQHKNTQG